MQLFEFLPIGDFYVHPIRVRLFVINYFENRPYLFWVDILLIICSLNFFAIFLIRIGNLRRNLLEGYCFSKEGVLNIGYIICQALGAYVFLRLFLNEKTQEISSVESEDIYYYYNDYSSYIDLYERYKLLKAIGLCILVARFSLNIFKYKEGEVIINSIKKIGDKFIFIFLINMGVVTAFSVMYTYGVGIYQEELNTFFKTFLVLVIFTLRNSLFDDLDIFDNFTLTLFASSYLILISIVGIYLQVLFSDTVRNVFLESDRTTIGVISSEVQRSESSIMTNISHLLKKIKSCFSRTNPEEEAQSKKLILRQS